MRSAVIQNAAIALNVTLTDQERGWETNRDFESQLAGYLSSKDHPRYDRKREGYAARCVKLTESRDTAFQNLMTVRTDYLRRYPNRNFPVNTKDNQAYDHLLKSLSQTTWTSTEKRRPNEPGQRWSIFKMTLCTRSSAVVKPCCERTS